MAVLINLTTAEQYYLVHVLLNEAADCARDPALARMHEHVLALLRAVCEGSPLVITNAGRVFIVGAIQRMQDKQGTSETGRTIIDALLPTVSVQS